MAIGKTTTFESAMEKLHKIVERLESGEESLDSSLKLFEEGTALASFCYQKLNTAEQKVKELTLDDSERQDDEITAE